MRLINHNGASIVDFIPLQCYINYFELTCAKTGALYNANEDLIFKPSWENSVGSYSSLTHLHVVVVIHCQCIGNVPVGLVGKHCAHEMTWHCFYCNLSILG
jgi:hypothetical protein